MRPLLEFVEAVERFGERAKGLPEEIKPFLIREIQKNIELAIYENFKNEYDNVRIINSYKRVEIAGYSCGNNFKFFSRNVFA